MHESAVCFHHLEWPAPGTRVRGPVLFLRGWAVGRSGHELVDVRARTQTHTTLGVLGLPRSDLAAHFQSKLAWLPAEFSVAIPVADGTVEIAIEVMDADGAWHTLQDWTFTVAPDGEVNPRPEGEFDADRGWLSRSPPAPFQGHLDPLSPELQQGRAPLFGWLLHASQGIGAVFATAGPAVFNHLEANLADESLAAKMAALPRAGHARLRGAVDAPVTLISPACVRVYTELEDGSVHLCFARRFTPAPLAVARPARHSALRSDGPTIALPALPSGRPRRLLLGTLNLHPDDATLRALDVGRYLIASGHWAVRIITTADGPLHAAFENAGMPVQIIDPKNFFSAGDDSAARSALTTLERGIWWGHLDLVIAFDPLCRWLLTLAGRRGLPTLAEWPDSPESVQPIHPAPITPAWFDPALPILSRTDARAALGLADTISIAVFPCVDSSGKNAHLALHTADWLARHQTTAASSWRFVLLDGRHSAETSRLRADSSRSNLSSVTVLDQRDDRWLAAADAICDLGGDVASLRSLLNAAATAVPIIATASPALAGSALVPAAVSLIAPGNPLALAHSLLDLNSNSGAKMRRLDAAHRGALAHHHPAELLPRYARVVASICARRG